MPVWELWVMASQSAVFAAKTISDHEIHVLYKIDGVDVSSGPSVTLSQLTQGSAIGVPDDQRAALGGRYAQATVWKRATSTDVGQDFHNHIREIISGRREDLATLWTLDDTARRFLESASLYEQATDQAARVKKGLALTLSKAAKQRLTNHSIESGPLLVNIRDVALTLFKTGHGFGSAIIEFERLDRARLTALELLEAQISIVRFNKISWVDANNGVPVAGAPFTLSQMIRRLALADAHKENAAERVATYAYAQFAEPVPTTDRDVFALHLARHYTTDYVTSLNIGGVAFVADFETVRHAVALEGAATIVGSTPDTPNLPSFLENFKTGTFRRHYIPIALLAQHEHAFLVQRTSASVISQAEMNDYRKTVKRLEELRESSLVFRLCYRFSELSFITMHNALNHAFRQVLHLDRMLEELASDVAGVEMHLREVQEAKDRRNEQEKHRRFYWTTVIGSAALAGLTTFTIFKELGELFIHNHETAGQVAAVLGVLVAAIAGFFGYRKGPAAHGEEHGDHFTFHAMVDHMIERALK
jgi:hypothetical protein